MNKMNIGRPADEVSENYLCPRCEDRAMRKSGYLTLRNSGGERKVQRFVCTHCHYHTTKPISIQEVKEDGQTT